MNEPRPDEFQELPEAQMLRINRACNEFESLWQSGGKTKVEEILKRLAAADQAAALAELLPLEIEYRQQAGETLALDEFTRRFPQAEQRWLAELVNATQGSPRPSAEPPVPEMLGDYKIVSRLGGGGMGTVYKAVHTRMGRSVALKVLRTEMRRDPAWLQRFDREVRVAARLSHPNIVAALDAREQDGLHFLITELVDGDDLESTVRERGPLTVASAVECILQAAKGLDYAHRQGVVHRDIKPANLLRGANGVVKVLDMGLARLDGPDDVTGSSLTKAGMVMGTAAYMAPEQARDTRRADARSDIYSLGCTLHFLLTGRQVFTAETVVDTILSHVQQSAPSLAGRGNESLAALDGVFQRMVAKEPGDRYQSAADVVCTLEELLPTLPADVMPSLSDRKRSNSPSETFMPPMTAETPTVAYEIAATPRLARAVQTPRNKALWLIAGVLLFVVMIAGATIIATLPGWKKERPEPAPSPTYALAFNGASSYVSVPELVPTAGETYTLEAVVTPSEFRTSNVVSWLGPDWMALFLNADGHFGLGRHYGGVSYLAQQVQPARLGERVHLAGVFRGSELVLYVNGKAVETSSFTFALTDTNGGLFLGGVPSDRLPVGQNDRFFSGLIDAVRISRGARYEREYEPAGALQKDGQTIALFDLNEGRGLEIRGQGERDWKGRIVGATWQNVTP